MGIAAITSQFFYRKRQQSVWKIYIFALETLLSDVFRYAIFLSIEFKRNLQASDNDQGI